MKIIEVIDVSQSPERVWELFQDIPSMARCLPGAELTNDLGDGQYEGTVSAKLGPMTANFEGKCSIEADPAAKTCTITGKGADKRGGSVGRIKVDYSVVPGEISGSQVTVDADVQLSGAAAQFGRTGLIKSMSQQLITEFVSCIEAKLAADTVEEAEEVSAAEVKGFSLLFSSLGATIANFFRRIFGGGSD